MRFANYSEQYYPDRRELSKYLSDFPVYFDLNILYNAEVTFVDHIRVMGGAGRFLSSDTQLLNLQTAPQLANHNWFVSDRGRCFHR